MEFFKLSSAFDKSLNHEQFCSKRKEQIKIKIAKKLIVEVTIVGNEKRRKLRMSKKKTKKEPTLIKLFKSSAIFFQLEMENQFVSLLLLKFLLSQAL